VFDYPAGLTARTGRRRPRDQPVAETTSPDATLERIIGVERTLRRSNAWTHLVLEAATTVGLTMSFVQIDALDAIAELGVASVKDLASYLGVDPSTTSRVLSSLLDLGLLARAPSSRDRRVSEVRLSGEGARAHEQMSAARRSLLATRIQAMGRKREALLADVLEEFCSHMTAHREAPAG
jgi:DNA-binding MarR family transcriptional regulator